MVSYNIAIAEKVKLEDVMGDESFLLSVQCSSTGTEYLIQIPQVDSTCISIDNTVPSTKNAVW